MLPTATNFSQETGSSTHKSINDLQVLLSTVLAQESNSPTATATATAAQNSTLLQCLETFNQIQKNQLIAQLAGLLTSSSQTTRPQPWYAEPLTSQPQRQKTPPSPTYLEQLSQLISAPVQPQPASAPAKPPTDYHCQQDGQSSKSKLATLLASSAFSSGILDNQSINTLTHQKVLQRTNQGATPETAPAPISFAGIKKILQPTKVGSPKRTRVQLTVPVAKVAQLPPKANSSAFSAYSKSGADSKLPTSSFGDQASQHSQSSDQIRIVARNESEEVTTNTFPSQPPSKPYAQLSETQKDLASRQTEQPASVRHFSDSSQNLAGIQADVVSNSIFSNASYLTKTSSDSMFSRNSHAGSSGSKTAKVTGTKSSKQLYSTKSSEQRKFLVRRYKENPNWTKEVIEAIAEECGLESIKVYKWVWDRREYRLKKIDKLRAKAKINQHAGNSAKNEAREDKDMLCEEDCPIFEKSDSSAKAIFVVTKVERA